jgi:hypothetical protein
MDGTMTINPKGMSRSQERRYLAQQPKMAKGTQRRAERRKGTIQIDWKAVERLKVPCWCRNCQAATRWPSYYMIRRVSYECVLEAHAPMDEARYNGRVSTSSSPTAIALQHARLTGARIERGCELEPESDEALKAEIRRATGH